MPLLSPCIMVYLFVCSTTLAKSETFLEIDAWVYDMQPDYYRGRGNFLIGAASSFRTTDGKTTTTLYNHTVMGFTQVNKTHVVLAIYAHHCLKILNRETLHTKILAGTEDSKGFQDGGVGVGMFYLPWQVKVDIRNWGKLLVTDQLNNALRSVDLDTGVVETVIQSGFNNPQGLEWAADNKLLITNHFHYISEVEWLDNGTVSGNVLAGSNEHGDVNGPFSEARFKMLYDIERFKGDKYLVADFESRKLKLIDVKKQTVSPFCFENERSCVTSSTLPYHPLSILNFEGEIFVGMRKDIYKLTSELLTPFVYHQPIHYLKLNITYYYKLIFSETKLMMRLQFQAKYIFPCLFFNDTSLLEQLENALSEKKKYINEACSNCESSISILHKRLN